MRSNNTRFRKALALAKKEPLLMVLSHPEIPLHNNPAELGARQRVRKRDVSLQARTREGLEAWDTSQILVTTAKKQGVNLFSYFSDRIKQSYTLPSLAALIEEQAASLALGSSWQQAPWPSPHSITYALPTEFLSRSLSFLPVCRWFVSCYVSLPRIFEMILK